jgi:hypothetical protein
MRLNRGSFSEKMNMAVSTGVEPALARAAESCARKSRAADHSGFEMSSPSVLSGLRRIARNSRRLRFELPFLSGAHSPAGCLRLESDPLLQQALFVFAKRFVQQFPYLGQGLLFLRGFILAL